ncbi:hypothetical protein JST97_38660 [bacterium]|nr:hypothetical protein [bacterium]
MSELDEFIEQRSREGSWVSSGEFTLERKKALEKTARYQLGRPTAWILKIVQAAVAAGSERLDIFQTLGETQFEFLCKEDWSGSAFEHAFFSPEAKVSPGLEYLRRALWSAGIGGGHPFHFVTLIRHR